MNPNKQTIALAGLLLMILLLTASAASRAPATPILGGLGSVLILGLMTWYLVLLILNRNDIIAAFAAIILRPRNAISRRSSFLFSVLGYAVGTALFILIVWSLTRGSLAGFGNFNTTIFTGIQQGQPPQVDTGSTFLLSGPLYFATAVFLAIGAVSVYILLQGLRLAVATRSEIRERLNGDEGTFEVKREVLESVQYAITGLKGAKGYYEAILECYKRMCKILSDAGLVISPTETAREFAQEVSAKLHFGGVAVVGLTFLFEEARYSDHQIAEEKRTMAVRHLELLEQALSQGTGSEA